jgi:hypothetical protein
MTTETIRKHRNHAFISQRERCYYCDCPMWLDRPESFAGRFGIRPEEIHLFQCTAEHKIARQDRGKDTRDNIVAACWHCNHQRHADKAKALDSLDYAVYVAFAVLDQTWPTLVTAKRTGGSPNATASGESRLRPCARR